MSKPCSTFAPATLHMVSQIETLLEAQRNALVKQRGLLALLTRDQERSPKLDQFDLVSGIAGDGHGDPILIFTFILDVVGRHSDRTLWSSMSKSRSKPTVER
jgi:hypothetical protein